MRLLVACSACHRRYDATGRPPGSRFHCHCGQVVEVQVVKGHEAAVTRCGNCGAPRQPNAVNCGFCGATFEEKEVARNTVCPSCMTRCTDGAKFCHHCGTALGAESLSAEVSDLGCPVCGDDVHLEHHRLGDGPAVLECPKCAGIWLEHSKVDELVQAAAERAQASTTGLPPAVNTGSSKPQTGPMYRSCPACKCMMNRKNFGRSSGIVIDVCKEHGTWFDADELPQILRWVEQGGLRKAAMLEHEHQRRQTQLEQDRQDRARRAAAAGMSGDHGGFGRQRSHGYDADDVVEGVIRAVGALAGWFKR